MKLYLDDERAAPSGWTQAYTAPEAIVLLSQGGWQEVSLAHDLGAAENGTGHDVLVWVEGRAAEGLEVPEVIGVHTANPAARVKMLLGVVSIERFRDEARRV